MPGTISVTCPQCRKKGVMRVDPGRTGKVRITCPSCGAKFEHAINRRSYYRKTPLPMIRFGPMDFDFKDLSHRGELMDISATGCRIRFDGEPPRKNEQLGLYFRLPSAEPPTGVGDETSSFKLTSDEYISLEQNPEIRIGGEVVWVREDPDQGCEFGVRFVYQDEHARKTIGFYLLPYHEPLTRK